MIIKSKRKYLILLFVSLMVSAIIILDLSMLHEQEAAHVEEEEIYSTPEPIPSEAGVFKHSEFALDYESMPDDPQHQRSLESYYKNRAYAGAPPTIPHIILSESGIGGKSCLQCHQNGGYVAQFNANAPVTPHPELINCKQCHVPVKSNTLFKETNFTRLEEPEINNQALPGSPPIIPHALQMRENCLACHAGPAAPKEIRVTHPERINCRQCHATKPALNIEWTRLSSETRE